MAPRNGRSPTDSWCTPKWLADALGPFDLDPCSNERSHIHATRRIQLPEDGLATPWDGSVFCNPPYSAPLPWCERLAGYDLPWVALVKLDTSTAWWRVLMASGAQWAPFRERLRFEPPAGVAASSNNFCSALVWRHWQPRELADRLWIR